MQLTLTKTASPAASASTVLDKPHADLKKATQQFESYFVDMLFKEMRKTVPDDTLLGDSDHQTEIFTDMMDQDVSDSISKRGDFGLAKMMYSELSKHLAPNNPAAAVGTAASAASASAIYGAAKATTAAKSSLAMSAQDLMK